MKIFLTLVLLLLLSTLFSQGHKGKMKVTVYDRLTKMPFDSTLVITYLNDTIQHSFATDSEGSGIISDLDPILYKLKISIKGYLTYTIKDIKIGEGKTSYISCAMLSDRPLTKKEKKKLGIK